MTILSSVVTSAVLSGAYYTTFKLCSNLCERPIMNDGRIPTIFEQFRAKCADLRDCIAGLVGERNWNRCTTLLADAWIIIFAVAMLILNSPISHTFDTMTKNLRTPGCIAYSTLWRFL